MEGIGEKRIKIYHVQVQIPVDECGHNVHLKWSDTRQGRRFNVENEKFRVGDI